MKTAIIDICSDTPKLKLRLGTRGCNGSQVIMGGVELHIKSVCCDPTFPVNAPLPIDMCNGCSPSRLPGTPAPPAYTPQQAIHAGYPTAQQVHLVYPALGVDNDGLTEFYFDGKLFANPPGRYKASIVVDQCSCMEFDINLCCNPIEIEQIVLEGIRSCEEGC